MTYTTHLFAGKSADTRRVVGAEKEWLTFCGQYVTGGMAVESILSGYYTDKYVVQATCTGCLLVRLERMSRG